jgi:hypothetical protein
MTLVMAYEFSEKEPINCLLLELNSQSNLSVRTKTRSLLRAKGVFARR